MKKYENNIGRSLYFIRGSGSFYIIGYTFVGLAIPAIINEMWSRKYNYSKRLIIDANDDLSI